MKLFKIVIISLVALIAIVVIAAVVLIKTFDVNRYKPQIIAEGSKALARQIDFQKASLDLSLSQGVSLKIGGLSIAEDPGFGKGDFVSVKDISVGVDLLGYIFQKKITVTSILVDSPRVSVIRKKDGTINALTVAQPVQAGKEIVKAAPAAAVAIPAILVSSVRIVNAQVDYLDESFEPPFRLQAKELAAVISNISVSSAGGQMSLAADLELEGGTVQLKELASPISNLKAQAKLRGNDLVLVKASLEIGSGSVSGSGELKDYLSKQDYNAAFDIKELKLQELVAPDKAPVKAEGSVSGSVKIKGAGFTPEALKSSLSGNGELALVKAKLVGVNALRAILDKISVIPGLSTTVESGLPEKYQQKLTQKDTELSDIKLPFTIENGQVIANDISIGADEFTFKGSGRFHLSGAYGLEGAVYIEPELSAAMVSQVSQLQYLLNETKQIYLPLKVSGNAGAMKFELDPQYIAEKLVANQAKQQLFKAIEKAVGGKGSGSEGQSGSGQTGGNTGTSAEEAVGNLLGNIFKKK